MSIKYSLKIKVLAIDVLATNGEVNIDDDSDGEGITAHFPAHANEPVAALEFDPSGMLLFTSCRLGHSFHIFRIFPHPASSAMGAVHHLYTLHRGETTAKVQDVTFSLDSRWVSVSTMRGTTHIFPITPYGGPISVRTHTSPRVVNRLSRFHRSAGLEEIQQVSTTGRNSPVLSGSPSSSGSNLSRAYDSHPSMAYQTSFLSRMGNSRLPPYPHPTTIQPLAQLKQALSLGLSAGASKPRSPGKDRLSKRKSSASEIVCISSTFAPARAWLVGSPSLTRDKRDKPAMDSLFVIDFHANLTEYILEPRPSTNSPKTDDSPIELEVVAHAQWNLLRPTTSPEVQPPLPNTNPLMFAPDTATHEAGRGRRPSESGLLSGDTKATELEESWLSEVEIITHAGPHRRLWMGPQFSFQTFQHSSNTTVLSSNSSALLSQSPETHGALSTDIFTEELEVQSLRPARSNPVAMPGSHQATSGSPGSLLFIEASSGSFEQLPSMLEVCGSWPENCPSMNVNKGKEEQLKESLADAMIEDPFDSLRSEGSSEARTAATTNLTPVQRNVPPYDRISNAEALILGVIAEHNLPFSMAPVLVNVSKTLAEDKKALNHLSLSRNCASHKMKFGVAKTFLQDTLKNLLTIKFSLNLDEATSNYNMRVLSVLASYFSPSVNRVVVEHLVSLNVVTVSSEKFFKEISEFFESNKIPWENLVSILMDSCRVMRGTKSGVETRIRKEKAPHLLDVDSDSCHHIHNASKKFCSPFDCWLENLMRDIFNDTNWSADIRDWLIEKCSILNLKYVSPVNVISHRWLSCYDAALSFLHMIEPLTFLYYAFLTLPLLKKYVCMFQSKQPLIHKLFEEQRRLFVDFLSCFMKQELLQGKSSKELLSSDVMNDMNHIGLSKMFVGAGTQSIISKGPNDCIKEEILYKVKKTNVNCADYLQKKLPLARPLLKCISSIDPATRGKDVTLKRLQKLPSFITNVLTSTEDKEAYALEIHQYQVDLKLPSPFDDSDFQGSYEELSSSSSHSGSVSHGFEVGASPQGCMEHHTLVFPSSRGSPDSS
ncbi:Breast carcinoma-amplified sequence 3 [Araneus ventricosus]|uniref:Breast carcinoma-amplified sequence 3 n=1 Tax=Araneus ventricosus TaxID=182803 RepID=A0A4Y2FHZ9_ARAVE|nr:Breast carcinoma-amplified sequence 3 [Araneus ventricosus]